MTLAARIFIDSNFTVWPEDFFGRSQFERQFASVAIELHDEAMAKARRK